MPEVKIAINEASKGSLLIDGHDVSYAATSVSVHASAGQPTRVYVELGHAPITFDGPAKVTVEVDDQMRSALIAGGWTPPADEDEDGDNA